jgi:hypothetical protein
MAFVTKDTLFVIDDFAPQGSSQDIVRYHAAADRVFRASGNHAGRGRLDSATRLREAKPPRSLILSTGEDIPRGQSVRARLIILEIAKGEIASASLSRYQRDAQAGLYAQAMGGFVRWLASRYEDIQAAVPGQILDLRAKAPCSPAHARTPDIVASLQVGFDLFLNFLHRIRRHWRARI